MKITIIGSGSAFTKEIVTDILNIEGLESGIIGLVDIDTERLTLSEKLVSLLVKHKKKNFQIIASADRKKILPDSDFVINQIEVAGLETVLWEYEIPLKYGVNQCIGDTMGPGGLFKSLRTLPAWIEIVSDIEALAPDCIILNYTNPMSVVTLVTSRITDIPVVGLCHSVQNSSQLLSEYLEIPLSELKWKCAGINHLAWFTELSYKKQDQYPVLLRKIKDPSLLAKDPVRFDFMKYCGYFMTESSGHFSEYIPYYRKRQSLIDRHCSVGYNGATGFYAENWPLWRRENEENIRKLVSGEEKITFENSGEYAAEIIEAVQLNRRKVIYGNVPNNGLISNLSQDGIVEVACLVDCNGIQPTHFGMLPEQLASLCRSNMSFFELTAQAVLESDREKAFQALLIDPLTSAVCSPEEIRKMFDELYKAEKHLLSI